MGDVISLNTFDANYHRGRLRFQRGDAQPSIPNKTDIYDLRPDELTATYAEWLGWRVAQLLALQRRT